MRDPARSARAPLQAFEVTVPASREDEAIASLWECGTTGMEVRAARRGRTVLVAYYPRRSGLAARLRAGLAMVPRAEVRPVAVPRVDWVARFRAGFRPFTAGRFKVVSRWLADGIHSRRVTPKRTRRDPDVIVIDPGRAFGTGTHASTRLCLAAFEDLAAEGPLGRVVDLGCGTGILSIAALRLGARAATGVEIDPEAVASARLHARLNAVRPRILEGDLGRPLRSGSYDTVLANLVAPMLVQRQDEIVGLGRAGARYVLSGLLADDLPLVKRRYRRVGRLTVRRDGEWAAVVVHRSPQ